MEASSAGKVRHRLNAVSYSIVLIQLRHTAEARAYVDQRMAAGKTWREAVRALKRFVVHRIFHPEVQCCRALWLTRPL